MCLCRRVLTVQSSEILRRVVLYEVAPADVSQERRASIFRLISLLKNLCNTVIWKVGTHVQYQVALPYISEGKSSFFVLNIFGHVLSLTCLNVY
jgi:hypothetical protein